MSILLHSFEPVTNQQCTVDIDGNVTLTQKELSQVDVYKHQSVVTKTAFSSFIYGSLLAIGDIKGKIYIWKDNHKLYSFQCSSSEVITELVFYKDYCESGVKLLSLTDSQIYLHIYKEEKNQWESFCIYELSEQSKLSGFKFNSVTWGFTCDSIVVSRSDGKLLFFNADLGSNYKEIYENADAGISKVILHKGISDYFIIATTKSFEVLLYNEENNTCRLKFSQILPQEITNLELTINEELVVSLVNNEVAVFTEDVNYTWTRIN